MEDEKSYNLPSANTKPKKTSDVIQPKSENVKTRNAYVNCSPRTGEDEIR